MSMCNNIPLTTHTLFQWTTSVCTYHYGDNVLVAVEEIEDGLELMKMVGEAMLV